MIGKKVNSVREIPLFEVKELLKERSSEGDMNYEQGLAYDYTKKFSKLTKIKGEKIMGELKEVEGMTDSLAIAIANILPGDDDVMKLLLPKEATFSDDQVKKMVESRSQSSNRCKKSTWIWMY